MILTNLPYIVYRLYKKHPVFLLGIIIAIGLPVAFITALQGTDERERQDCRNEIRAFNHRLENEFPDPDWDYHVTAMWDGRRMTSRVSPYAIERVLDSLRDVGTPWSSAISAAVKLEDVYQDCDGADLHEGVLRNVPGRMNENELHCVEAMDFARTGWSTTVGKGLSALSVGDGGSAPPDGFDLSVPERWLRRIKRHNEPSIPRTPHVTDYDIVYHCVPILSGSELFQSWAR